MKKILSLIAAVAIILVIGAVYFAYSSAEENEQDLQDNDNNLDVSAKIDLVLTFSDGTSKTITGKPNDPLTVEYDGSEVTSAQWYMKVKYDTPAGYDSYDSIQMTLTPSSFSEYDGSITDDFALEGECLTGDGQNTQVYFNSFSPSQGHEKSLDEENVWYMLYTKTIQMSDVFDNSVSAGPYNFIFRVTGYCCYRGLSDQGNGDWQNVDRASSGLSAMYPLNYYNSQATVEWDADVVWS